jgi:predicted aspartyl protease
MTFHAAPEPHAGAFPTEAAVIPLAVESNRPFIELTLKRADGTSRKARFLVDSGGGGFLMSEPLAHDLGLAWGEVVSEEGQQFAQVTTPPPAWAGTVALELDPARVLVVIGRDNILPKAAAGHADGMFPGWLLARYHVVFDYPKGTFTIGRAGSFVAQGTPMAMPVHPRSGFPRTEVEIDGQKYGFLIDTGASFTMISQAVLAAWGTAHADWPRHPGAFGEAATLGGQTLETMFVPDAHWGTTSTGELGVTSQQEGAFEKWMSSMMAAPIVGSLAGNILKHYRVELDYPNQTLYLSRP